MRQLTFVDYGYVLLACIAGVWQVWCLSYGRDNILTVILGILMGLPFALASYSHALFLSATDTAVGRPDWRRVLVLWAGMPVSFAAGALTIAAETGIMYVAGFGINNLPLYNLRLIIGEGAACLMWTACLLVWARKPGLLLSRSRFLAYFATLFLGALTAHGLSTLILRITLKDLYWLLESTFATTISAFILIFLRNEAMERSGNSDIASEA